MELFSKNIVLTNDEASAETIATLLRKYGANPLFLPCIKIMEPDSFASLDEGLDKLKNGFFSHIIFTSANAVKSVYQRLLTRGLHLQIFSMVRIVAIGAKTAETVEHLLEVTPQVDSKTLGAKQLMRQISFAPGQRVLFPKSCIALPTVEDALNQLGIEYHAAIAYRTIETKPPIDIFFQQKIDGIGFFSPSAVNSLRASLIESCMDMTALDAAVIACIGHTTAEHARAAGFRNIHVAKQPTAAAFTDLLRGYFNEHAFASRSGV